MVKIGGAQEEIKAMQKRLQSQQGYYALDIKELFQQDQNNIDQQKSIELEKEQSPNQHTSNFPQQNSQQLKKKYMRNEEIKYLKGELNQLNALQQIGALNIIKEYKYPISMSQLVQFIKEKDLDLFEQVISSRNLIKHKMNSLVSQEKEKEILKSKREHIKLFTMNERQQVKALKDWLHYMIENYVQTEDCRGVNRLINEQLILAFTLSDLKDQLAVECQERGEILDKILALIFDMFKCYDLSFENIIQEENKIMKESLQNQYKGKEIQLQRKEQEYERITKKQKDIDEIIMVKDNCIRSLKMENKAALTKFQVLKSLIDNLIFQHKQELEKQVGKSKEERTQMRDFIYQLKELKRFSTKDEDEIDMIEEDDQNNAQYMPSFKRKVNKETQTMNIRAMALQKRESRNEYKIQFQKQNKTQQNSEQKEPIKQNQVINENITHAQEEEIEMIPFSAQDNNQQVNQSTEFKQGDDLSIYKEKIEEVIDGNLELIENNKDSLFLELQMDQDQNNKSMSSSDSQEEQDAENRSEREQLKEEEALQQLEEYTPEQLLEFIQYYKKAVEVVKEQKEIQTEDCQQNQDDKSFSLNNDQSNFVNNSSVPTSPERRLKNSQKFIDQGLNMQLSQFDQPSQSNDDYSPVFRRQASKLVNNLKLSMKKTDSVNSILTNSSGGNNTNKLQQIQFQRRGTEFQQQPFQQQLPLSPANINKKLSSQNQNIQSSSQRNQQQNEGGGSVEDFFEEVQNLTINDLDSLLSQDKQYSKRSMSLLQSLMGQIKKTKAFKALVEKSAKEKLREEEKNQKDKEGKWSKKNNSLTVQQQFTLKFSNEIQNKQQQQLEVSQNKVIIEEHSLITSSSSEEELKLPTSNKQKKSNNIVKRNSRRISNVGSTQKPNNSMIINKSVKKVDKEIQVTIIDEQYEMIKKNRTLSQQEEAKQSVSNTISSSNTSSNSKQHQVQAFATVGKFPSIISEEERSATSSSRERSTQPVITNIPTVTEQHHDNSKTRIKQMIQMVGKVSVAFKGKGQAQSNNSGNIGGVGALGNSRTVPQPFSLGIDRSNNKQKTGQHPISKFLPLFLEKIASNDKAYLNVNPISIKSAIKYVYQYYWDKAIAAKDSIFSKSQTMIEFMYDQLYNKYGIATITEKKLKEILLGVINNRQQNVQLSLFSKFANLESNQENNYSNDDLAFFYKLNKNMVLNDCFQVIIRKEFNFESPNIILQNSIEILNSLMTKKLQTKTVQKISEDLQVSLKELKPISLPTGQMILSSDKFFDISIALYRKIKIMLFEQLKLKCSQIFQENETCLFERVFDYEEFVKIINMINTNKNQQLNSESLLGIFENYRIMIGSQSNLVKEEDKRINLESILSMILKYELITV